MADTVFFSKREFVDIHTLLKKNSIGKSGRQCGYCSKFWLRHGRSYFNRVFRHVASMHPDDFQRGEKQHEDWVNWVRQNHSEEFFNEWIEIQKNINMNPQNHFNGFV